MMVKNKGRRRDTNLASSKTLANLEIYIGQTSLYYQPSSRSKSRPPPTAQTVRIMLMMSVNHFPSRNEKSLPLLFVFSREITLPHLGWISNLYSQMNPSTNRKKPKLTDWYTPVGAWYRRVSRLVKLPTASAGSSPKLRRIDGISLVFCFERGWNWFRDIFYIVYVRLHQ